MVEDLCELLGHCLVRRLGNRILKLEEVSINNYRNKQLSDLLDCLGNQQEFLKKVNEIVPSRKKLNNNISVDINYEHFLSVVHQITVFMKIL